MNTPAMTPQQKEISASNANPLEKYKMLAVGVEVGWVKFLVYEFLTTFLTNIPGILGLGLRAIFYPLLLGSCGAKPAIGRGVLIRGAGKIKLGKNVVLDDYAVLDARGENASIEIGDHVCVGRFSSIVSKNGRVVIGAGSNIGSHCRIATQSSLTLNESVLVAAYAYIGPGNHQQADDETPLIERGMEIKGGVTIGAHSWIGTKATVMDGVTLGERAVVAAHAFVKDHVPAGNTVGGVPAKILKS